MSRVKDDLYKARAVKPAMPEIDVPAKACRFALANAVPLDRDIVNYIEAKADLSDKGAHGRKTHPAYIAAIEKLARAQVSYTTQLRHRTRPH